MIVVGGGVFALAAFHYLVWGWWLSEKLYREEAEADSQRRAEGCSPARGGLVPRLKRASRIAAGQIDQGSEGLPMVVLTPAEELGLSGSESRQPCPQGFLRHAAGHDRRSVGSG